MAQVKEEKKEEKIEETPKTEVKAETPPIKVPEAPKELTFSEKHPVLTKWGKRLGLMGAGAAILKGCEKLLDMVKGNDDSDEDVTGIDDDQAE